MTSQFIDGWEFNLMPVKTKRSEPVKNDSTKKAEQVPAYRLRVGHLVVGPEGTPRRIDRLGHTSKGITYRVEGSTEWQTVGVDDLVAVVR